MVGGLESSKLRPPDMEPSVMDRAVKAGGYVLHVRAVAGVESCCYVESVDVAFDIGRCFGRVVSKSHVFITHGHIDHIAAFAAHAGRRALQKMAPAKYYAPAHLVPHMQSIIDSFSVMQEDSIPAKIIPVEPHQEIHIDGKWAVRAFPTCHRVPSLGYIVYAKRNKLRADLVGRDSKDIAALRKAGESVTELDQSPAIAYTGDTTIDVFLHAAERGFGDLLRVKALVTEATYVDTHKTPADAESRGHIHLHQLIEHADLFAEVESLVLVHSSARYAAAEINEVIMAQLPLSLRDKTIVAGR